MTATSENIELHKFYISIKQDIRAVQLSEENGGTTEQIFTQLATDMLTSAGESENVRIAYDQKAAGTKNQHQVNAYSISDNYETLDLFITVLKGTDELSKVTKAEIETATKRVTNFFRKCIYKDYVHEIEESSEIFQLASELAFNKDLQDNLVRVNAIILTDGIYQNNSTKSELINGYSVYARVVDSTYLYNISEKEHVPIEIDFKLDGYEIPCIESPTENDEYKSYLAIMPGVALASIYERFGARLLEQNVRSFLQFTGKINKGIRATIMKEPHMFLAFNNGIAATADNIELGKDSKGNGLVITKVNNLQIVNGGQTTASIYHTLKKDKSDISNIYVQVKVSVVKNKSNFSEIVSRIAEYANTQNKVSVADLSSNKPFHIEFEKLSRSIFTPHSDQNTTQTKWFYERARGQYKNARLKDGFTPSRQKAFDIKNPKNQIITKEELAKYINAYQEKSHYSKIVVGPHFVIKNVKNYNQFIIHNTDDDIANDNIYFEDSIAKAILYKTCEKIYGVKPNAIGDLRFITVPYTIAYFGHKTNYQLDLYKIWRNQCISTEMQLLLRELMIKIDNFLKTESPESLIEMWARKEDCWDQIKKQDFGVDFSVIKADMIDESNPPKRVKVLANRTDPKKENIDKINSVLPENWKQIEKWGRETQYLTTYQQDITYQIAEKIRNNKPLSDIEIRQGLIVVDTVISKEPGLLLEMEEI